MAGKALCELGLQYGWGVKIFSVYGEKDRADGNVYFPQTLFTGFNNNKPAFITKSVFAGRRSDIVLLSHVNLLLVGILIKIVNRGVKLVLITHGIEVWRPVAAWKKWLFGKIDLFLPVSHFTKEKMKTLYGIPEEHFSVLNNCLSPFLERPLQPGKVGYLLDRYGLKPEDQVLLTVSRMSDTEQYKGYDRVLQALPALVNEYPNLRYLLVGKYDKKERERLEVIIAGLGIKDSVVFAGYVADEEMAEHFNLGDLFIMPSEKEGFGIVFIEAMFYGLPVIAGNKDGSADALCNGELGLLVDPDNLTEISAAIKRILDNPKQHTPNRKKLMEQFSYTRYKRKLHNCLERQLNR